MIKPEGVSTPEIVESSQQLKTLSKKLTLVELVELAKTHFVFNLGLVYLELKINFDLLPYAETDFNCKLELTTYELIEPLVDGLAEWSTIVQAVPLSQKSIILKAMQSNVIYDKRKQIYAELETLSLNTIPVTLIVPQTNQKKYSVNNNAIITIPQSDLEFKKRARSVLLAVTQ